jgi:DoxX-like family
LIQQLVCYSHLVSRASGIYVEILVGESLDTVWRLTQEPGVHQRWDLRFSRIEYLPRPDVTKPQLFLYETRIGFGLAIKGTGESIATRAGADGTVSSLKFASDDVKSLIREGSGYWRYVPTSTGLRFFTWYDYTVRFGGLGRLVDRFFRPAMGWATAWSFDRMRLWAEDGQPPEASLAFALIHATARIAIAGVWLWHGLVPKLLFPNLDEQMMLGQSGLPLAALPWIGGAEVLFGLAVLCAWRWRGIFLVNVVMMLGATAAVAMNSPAYLKAAFNPVTLNAAMIALSIAGWIAAARMPSASRCLRVAPKEEA